MPVSKELQGESQQSANWERYQATKGFIEEGSPFQERFPRQYRKKHFALIRRDGERFTASVDDSRQYQAEGLSWRTSEGELVYGHTVVAWKEQTKVIKNS